MTDLTGVLMATPLALLPVRLETRFVPGQQSGRNDLLVRVYPDQIHHDAHDQRLAPTERVARTRFVDEGGYGSNVELARAAWRRLADQFGPARAAWIARTGEAGADDPGERDALWAQPAMACCLPDCWQVLGYRAGQLVVSAVGRDIPGSLPIGPAPDEARPAPGPDGALAVPPSISWLADFPAAVNVGMALRVPMPDTGGLDRLLVFGVKAETGGQGATRLRSLLDAHHFTDGLALVAQGTPTNNSQAGASGMFVDDPQRERSRVRERGGAVCARGDGSDGARLAAALGLDASLFACAEGANGAEALDAQAMNAALWPGTWAPFIRRLVPSADEAMIEASRRHFVDWVRARGPLPTLRVGSQPYGVVPVVSLSRLQPDASPLEPPLIDLLRRLRPMFVQTATPLRPGQQSIPDILSRRAVSRGYRVRGAFSTEWQGNAEGFMGLNPQGVQARKLRAVNTLGTVRAFLNRWSWFTPLDGVLTLPDSWPGVLPTVLPDDELGAAAADLPAAWLAAFLARLQASLPNDPEPGWADKPADSVLYLLLRRAARLVATGTSGSAPAVVHPLPARGGFGDTPDGTPLGAYQDLISAVNHLSARPAATLDRVAREGVDLATHRLDAWITSLATKRLAALRPGPSASGVIVGGYAWLEDLRPAPANQALPVEQTPPGELPGLVWRANNAGFVQAPSVAQANTAAVLRAGHLAHAGEVSPTGTTPFALDLSSARVRLANQLLDGVRQGQSVGALLGYRFERALHEDGLAQYVPAFRALAVTAGQAESGLDDVVDGVALLRLRVAGQIPWGTAGLPAAGVADGALNLVTEVLDAVGDASVAEGVHQALQGNHARASAALAIGAVDAVAPTELEFVSTPRTGVGITHRLLLTLDAPALPASGPWAIGPRERAEPALAAWVAAVLPAPQRLRADLELRDPATGTALPVVRLYLSDLAPRPMDLLAETANPADLTQRLARHVLHPSRRPAGASADTLVTLLPDPAVALVGDELYLTDALEIVRTVAGLLGAARSADARDLTAAGGGTDEPADGVDLADLAARVDGTQGVGGAIGEFAMARDAVIVALGEGSSGDGSDIADPTGLAQALVEIASYGVAGALPPVRGSTDELRLLRRRAEAAVGEMDRRMAKAVAARGAGTATGDWVGALRALFGDGLTIVPRFTPDDPDEVEGAFTRTETAPAPPGQDPLSWFARMARVRRAVAMAESLGAYGQGLRTGRGLRLSVGQFPAAAVGEVRRWVGLPPATPDGRVEVNATSVVSMGAPPTGAGTLAALLVDEWAETVPAKRETTGVAYHYDAPGAQAPQAILLAVPPRPPVGVWTVEELADTLAETLDLARARTVDATDFGADHMLASLLLLPNWGAGETSTVDVGRLTLPPAGYGIPDTAEPPVFDGLAFNYPPSPAASTRSAVRQGKQVSIDATGQRFRPTDPRTLWSTDSAQLAVAVTPSSTPETRVTLRITAGALAPVGMREISVTTAGGRASRQIEVLPAFRLTYVSATALRREQLSTDVSIFVDGQRLAAYPTMTVQACACHGYVTGRAYPVAGSTTRFELRLHINGNPRPPVTWDPTEPGGPLKPPKAPVSRRQAEAMQLDLTIAKEPDEVDDDVKITIPIIMDALHWVVYEL